MEAIGRLGEGKWGCFETDAFLVWRRDDVSRSVDLDSCLALHTY